MANQTSVPSAVEDHGVPPVAEARRLAQMFQLFADATRARILYALLETEELCVNDISAALDVPETSVSHALRLLRIAGVVKNRRAGRLIYYSLDDEHIRMLLRTSREHLAHG
ncbi:MAG TPA: metalloregulator ArsR/SmtB family transcription factor [Actinomycetota bacterium]|jgi:DNA-binding transcriptional ArsR family regulator|nr:metalloregulator ArsR/SmtB family transcription factor [Actinomycetota bacterium]